MAELPKVSQLDSISLANWRNFDSVYVELADIAFLIGPNASGKSNFLDAIRFLHDISAVGGGFQAAVNKRGGVTRLRSLSARRFPAIEVKVRVRAGPIGSAPWEYELSFVQNNRQQPVIEREVVKRGDEIIVNRPTIDDERDTQRLSQTYLEQVNVNAKFRALADFFRSIKYLHIVPQLVREPDRISMRKNDPFGSDFLEQVANTPQKTQKARLRRIRDALRVAVPQLNELELTRDNRGMPHLRGRYEHWRPHGAWQEEADFSDGTLRLLGLLWSLLDGSGPLLLEEPELSLHSAVVGHVPQMIAKIQRKSRRQVIVSTHSLDLLSSEVVGLDQVLVLQPSREGTTVHVANEFPEIEALVRSGMPVGEAVVPRTRPAELTQLGLFSE